MGAVEGEDADVASGDEHHDAPAVVRGSDSDVVEPAVVAQGDGAVGVDLVVTDAVAGAVDVGSARVGAFSGGEGFDGWSASDRSMGTDVVVVGDEAVELCLELFLGGGRVLFGEVSS